MRRSSDPGKRFLATVLFTDIVGSTDLAAELGDRRWRELIARHHALIRRELKRFGGREIDTAGDGFFATFPAPAEGIRCACEASDAVHRLGIDIRASLHVGECEQMGKKVGGIAVHTAARVLSATGAGEVFVTATSKDLVGGSDISFEDRGVHQLKGVPGEWRLFAVDQVDGRVRPGPLEKEAAAQLRASIVPPPMLKRRRFPIAVGAGVLIVAGAVSTFLLTRSGGSVVPAIRTVAEIPAGRDSFSRAIDLASAPTGVAAGEGSVWVINQSSGTAQRIDPDAADPIAATESTGGPPTGIAVGEGAAWITTGFGTVPGTGGAGGELYKFDPRTDHVTSAVPLPGGKALAVGDGFVWVADDVNDRVLRIDPKTGHSGLIPVGSQPVAIAIEPGENSPVWVANAVDATVSRIDPRTERVASFDVGGHPSGIAVDSRGGVWVTSSIDNTITRLDATGHTVATIGGIPKGPTPIAVSNEGVWVGGSLSHSIARIDPRTNKVVEVLTVSGTPTGIAVDSQDDVWVTVGAA